MATTVYLTSTAHLSVFDRLYATKTHHTRQMKMESMQQRITKPTTQISVEAVRAANKLAKVEHVRSATGGVLIVRYPQSRADFGQKQAGSSSSVVRKRNQSGGFFFS
jgi:hypothetical protein